MKVIVAAIVLVASVMLLSCTSVSGSAPPGGCFLSNAEGWVIPFNDSVLLEAMGPDAILCPVGFYCPNSFITNKSSWPAICPPSEECVLERIAMKFCEPQGAFEPLPCPAGFFCPTQREKHPCPSKHFCPVGATQPQKCSAFSHCPEGSTVATYFGGLFAVCLIDIVLGVIFFWSHRSRSKLEFEDDLKDELSISHSMVFKPPETLISPSADLSGSTRKRLYSALSEGFRLSRGSMRPLTFEFEGIRVTIPADNGRPTKKVLQNVCGKFQPGKVTAIMGPTGAGKTMVLNTIMDHLDSKWIREGKLNVSGYNSMAPLKKVVGFVPQDDVLHEEFTVDQNIWYSSEARLPASWDEQQRDAFRQAILDAMDLDKVRHKRVGGGLTGGQRKRVSVALELAAAPTALFLDEPTTGLDSYSAVKLCGVLQEIAEIAEIPVIMVVHQPRLEIWNALDDVLLLAPGGLTVYQGSQITAKQYFMSKMFCFNFDRGNPADIILDGLAREPEKCHEAWNEELASRKERSNSGAAEVATNSSNPTSPTIDKEPIPDNGASFLRQLYLVHMRATAKTYCRAHLLALDVLLACIASAFPGTAAMGKEGEFIGPLSMPYTLVGPKPKVDLLPMIAFFYMLGISTAAPSGVRTFGLDMIMYWREASSGQSRVAYFIAYTLVDIYRILICSLHFTVVGNLMWRPWMSFGDMYVLIFLCSLAIDSQSAMLGMIFHQTNAPLVAVLAAVIMTFFSGYTRLGNTYFAYAWWFSEGIMDRDTVLVKHVYDMSNVSDFWGYKMGRYWLDILMLVFFVLLYRVVAFILLISLNRHKQR